MAGLDGKTVAGAALMAAVVLVGIGMAALYAGGPPPTPERPKPAEAPEVAMQGDLRFSPVVYRGQLEQDARTFGVTPPTLEEFQAPFLYVDEVRERQKLDVKSPVETPHLRLSLDVEKNRASLDGQTFQFDHLVLRIENKTAHYLAYRIQTDVPNRKKCGSKGDIPHNAIVIEPKQTLRRTECLYRHNTAIEVTRVEVIELPALAAVYASRMPANAVLYDQRTASGPRAAARDALPADLQLARGPRRHRQQAHRLARRDRLLRPPQLRGVRLLRRLPLPHRPLRPPPRPPDGVSAGAPVRPTTPLTLSLSPVGEGKPAGGLRRCRSDPVFTSPTGDSRAEPPSLPRREASREVRNPLRVPH